MTRQADISVELSAYLDGQLTPDVAKWVDLAVTENPELARQLHDLRRIRTILRAIEPAKPNKDFVARVLAEAERRGLMRQVVRERMVQGIIRLASAAAAVLLIGVVVGVALQSFLRPPVSPASLSGTNPETTIIAATPEGQDDLTVPGRGGADEKTEGALAYDGSGLPMSKVPESSAKWSDNSASRGRQTNGRLFFDGLGGNGLRKDLGGLTFDQDGDETRTLKLAVADLGAGAKEVEAALASAGIVRTAGGAETIAKLVNLNPRGHENGTTLGVRDVPERPAKPAAPEPSAKSAPAAKPDPVLPEMFYRAPGEPDELRFVVVAKPEQIAALTSRLGDLRQNEELEQSLRGLCAAGVARPGAGLPKAVSAPQTTSTAAEPGPKARPTTEPHYHIAELQRLANNSQGMAWQRATVTAPTSQVAGQDAQPSALQANPGLEVLIITVRLRPPETNRADPGRNISQ